MNGKQVVLFGGLLTISLFLAACGAPPTPKVNDAAGTEIVATFMAQITQTAVAAGTPTTAESTPAADETEEIDIFDELETAEAAGDLDVTPTPGAYQSLLSRFRFVTVSQGNLYVRDGTGLPKQITQSGTDHDPVISADGQKIAFYRGEKFNNVFVINADGSGEKAIINNKLLPALGNGEVLKSARFLARTHKLFFYIKVCGGSDCKESRFFANVDTAEITEFAKGLNGSSIVSPDGQYFSFVHETEFQMDLYRLDGRIVRANLLPSVQVTTLQEWSPDSSELVIFGSSASSFNHYAFWRYTLKDDRVEQLLLEPAPAVIIHASCIFSISPDQNWILYVDREQKTHLANLKTAETQPYQWDDGCNGHWSPDSQYFASNREIGFVDDTPPIILDHGVRFTTWLDATHYLFSKGKSVLELQTYIAEVGHEADATQVDFLWSPVYAVLEPTPAP